MNIRDLEHGIRHGDLTIAFESKIPHTTWCLMICHNEGAPPKELISDLNAAGWELDGTFGTVPACGREEALLCKDGTGLFGGWADDEQFLPEAVSILEKHGVVGVPMIELTEMDML